MPLHYRCTRWSALHIFVFESIKALLISVFVVIMKAGAWFHMTLEVSMSHKPQDIQPILGGLDILYPRLPLVCFVYHKKFF